MDVEVSEVAIVQDIVKHCEKHYARQKMAPTFKISGKNIENPLQTTGLTKLRGFHQNETALGFLHLVFPGI